MADSKCWSGSEKTEADRETILGLADAYKAAIEKLHEEAGPTEEGTPSTFNWTNAGVEKPSTSAMWKDDGPHKERLDKLEFAVEGYHQYLDWGSLPRKLVPQAQEMSESGRVMMFQTLGAEPMFSDLSCANGNAIERMAHDDYQQYMLEVIEENNPEAVEATVDGLTADQLQAALDFNAAKCEAGQGALTPQEAAAPSPLLTDTEKRCAAVEKAKDQIEELEKKKDQIAKVLSSGAAKDSITFKEQCFLLAHIVQLAKFKTAMDESLTTRRKKLPYETQDSGNACLLATGDPFAFINKLTQHVGEAGGSTKEALFDIRPAELSSLQPMIRLFKVVTDREGNESQIELKFDSFYTSEAYPGATNPKRKYDADRDAMWKGYDLEDFLNVKERRGHGVGIKYFNVVYEADNPYAIKKSIRAKLVLHANTFDELLRDRGGYTYADLALKTGGPDGAGSHPGCVSINSDQLNPLDHGVSTATDTKLNFRLKAIVGWARPSTDVSIVNTPNLKTAIDDSCISLNLTPTIHEFNIDDTGRVEFTLNYLAYVEDFFDQPIFNIFSDPEITARQITRKLKYQTYNKECEAEKVSAERESEKEALKTERNESMRTLINRMLFHGKIQYIDVPLQDLLTFHVEGPLGSQFDVETLTRYINPLEPSDVGGIRGLGASGGRANKKRAMDIQKAMSQDAEQSAEAIRDVNPTQSISYFYISDLIDMILEGIEKTLEEISGGAAWTTPAGAAGFAAPADDPAHIVTAEQVETETANYVRYRENFKKFRVLLGPMEVVNVNPDGGAPESRFICMGDVAISVRYFIEWLTKKLLKSDKSMYPLPRFLNDFFNEFLRTFLNNDTCFNNVSKQSTRLGQSSLTAYKSNEWTSFDEITEAIVRQNPAGTKRRLRVGASTNAYPLLSISGQRDNAVMDPGFEREINYLVYFVSRTYPTERMNGNRAEDHQQGIWHYQIGKPTGIVKTIQLTKTDAPGLKEVRFEQEGYDGLQQLREVYDAKINTYADVSAFPGSYIYIDPNGFSPSISTEYDLTQLGVGGYHMIIRSDHTFGPGQAESTLTAKWVAELTKPGCKIPKEGDTKPDPSYEKCTLPGAPVGDQRATAVGDLDAEPGPLASVSSWYDSIGE